MARCSACVVISAQPVLWAFGAFLILLPGTRRLILNTFTQNADPVSACIFARLEKMLGSCTDQQFVPHMPCQSCMVAQSRTGTEQLPLICKGWSKEKGL